MPTTDIFAKMTYFISSGRGKYDGSRYPNDFSTNATKAVVAK